MTEAAMVEGDRNLGTRREAAARNARLTIYGALGLAGGLVGYLFGFYETGDGPGIAQGNIPAWLAIILAIVTALALVGGSYLAWRRMDEVEWQHNRVAAAVGAAVVMTGYPIWYLLWKGQLVSGPSHEAVFITLYLVTTAAYFYRKFR